MTSEVEYNAHMARMQAAYMEEDAAKARMRPSVLFRPVIYNVLIAAMRGEGE